MQKSAFDWMKCK